MRHQAFVMGQGNAGQAVTRSLGMLRLEARGVELLPAIPVPRGTDLRSLRKSCAADVRPVLFITTPHALHARTILDADRAGFDLIAVEKPAATRRDELAPLRDVRASVAVLHGYRQMWGIQKMKCMLQAGELGELVTIEGGYRQSSSAVAAAAATASPATWKNDPSLSGPHDVLLDLAPHWLDAAYFLAGAPATHVVRQFSFANAAAAHRDSLVQLSAQFPSGVLAQATVSKISHGCANDLTITCLGTKRSATWAFAAPDVLTIGEGGSKRILPRQKSERVASGMPPFHSLGWLEGYLAVIEGMLTGQAYPTLAEHLDVMDALLP